MKITINSKTAGKFRRDFLNNREHIVTDMVPLVADSIMNGGLYPLDEVKNSFTQLDNLPAPNGHPKVNGEHVSAFHPLAINAYNIGGFVRNPRMDGKKVINEFWLDLEIANQSDDGKELIRRIENAEEVGVSTGLTVLQDNTVTGKNYSWVARDMQFDHVAILLNEKAAGAHVGTKLQTNQAGLIICNVADQTQAGAASMSKNKTGVAGVIGKIVNAISAAFVGNATVENIRIALQAALTTAYSPEQFYCWICDFDQEAGIVFYEVNPREGGEYKTYQDTYTLSDDGTTATLGGSPVEVRRETKFVPVGGDASKTQSPKEGETMPTEQNANPAATTVAAAAPGTEDADKAALDAAVKLLESKGYKVVAADAENANATTVATNAALRDLLAREQAEADKLRKDLIANGLAEADVAGLSKDSLVRLTNSIAANKPQDYSLAGGRSALRVVASNNAGDYHESYTTSPQEA